MPSGVYERPGIPSYSGLHKRVVAVHGKANQYPCARCSEYGVGRQAQEWAQVHDTDGLDVWADYLPMCRYCHRQYDQKLNTNIKRSQALAGKPWSAARQKAHVSKSIEHGTPAGYQRCLKIGIPCQSCKDARAIYIRQRKARMQ